MMLSKNNPIVQVSIDDLQQSIVTYLQQVENGVILLVVKAGKPIAEITPVDSAKTPLRPFGLCAGEFTVPDDFDESLPEDMIQAFEGR